MRVELHSKLNPERTRRAIVSPVVTFEMVYTSLQESEHPSKLRVLSVKPGFHLLYFVGERRRGRSATIADRRRQPNSDENR